MESIFPYAAQHRGLLLAAKDLQDPSAIALFDAVYSAIAVKRLLLKFSAHPFGFVILARSRVQRLASTHWHPNDFWFRCLSTALKEMRKNRQRVAPLPIFMMPSLNFKKRAQLSSEMRRQELAASEVDCLLDVEHDKQIQLQERSLHVLVLDDVLTSGGTLHKEWTDLYFTRQSQECVHVHALTLFRTPGVFKSGEEDVS